ncbi:MAG: ABC transporter permease [Cyclobacteriaceae bacterium]
MLRNYLTIAFRNLRKRPFYTSINIFGLALGMACTLLIIVYILHELSYDRFHRNADRIYRLGMHVEVGESGFIGARVSPGVSQPFTEEITEVAMAVRMNQHSNKILRRGDITIKEDNILAADSGFFQLFNFPLLQGNPETTLQKPNSVVMTEAVSQKYFQNENPVGQQILIDDEVFQVTGIMEEVPTTSHFKFDIVYSFLSDPASKIDDWGNIDAYTYFLLQENASIKNVDVQAEELLKKYFGEYDLFQELGYTVEMFTQPMTEIHLHSHMRGEFEANGDVKYLYIFGAIALFTLLIACINFMNLATARSADRAKEVGIRKTMGSLRAELIRQFLGEALLLSLFSTLLALALAELLRIPFSQIADKPIHLPYHELWFIPTVILLGILVGVLAGSYPAFYLTRFRPMQVLRGRLVAGSKNVYLRNSLVVFQFAISIVLIVCTLAVNRQLQYIRNKDLGFTKENVLVLDNGKSLEDSKDAFYNALTGLSEVKGVSFTDVSPLAGYNGTVFIPAVRVDSIEGETFRDEDALILNSMMVSHDYLPTMNIQLKEGRNFSRTIAADSANYAIILNEQAVKALGLPQPIGSTVMVASEFEGKVVGVVEDYHYQSLHSQVEPLVLVLSDQQNYVEISITSNDLPRTVATIEEQWKQHTDGMPIDYSFLDEDFDALFKADERTGMIFGGFSLLAIAIACLGLLALAAFMAEQRNKEIGIRKVLGASVKNIVILLSKDFTRLILIAFVVATPLAYWAIQQWLNDFAYRTNIGLSTFVLSGTMALLIALLTVSYQSIKAAVANPVDSLRNE